MVKDHKDHASIPVLNQQPYKGLEDRSDSGQAENDGGNRVQGHDRHMYGGYWRRGLAYLVDLLMVNILLVLAVRLLDLAGLGEHLQEGRPGEWLLYRLIFVAYFTLTTYFSNGYTIGKALFGLQTVEAASTHLSLSTCLVREGIGKAVFTLNPFLTFLLSLSIFFSKKHQNFMDFFTDTNVVDVRQVKLVQAERNRPPLELE